MGKYDLTDIQSIMGDNLGGICSFVFVPKEWISIYSTIDAVTGEAKTAITLQVGYNWLEGACLVDSMEFTEEQKESSAGSYYAQKLSGVINRDQPNLNLITDVMRYYQCVVIYKDRNHKRKLIGDKITAMNFTHRLSTGLEVKDKTAFYFDFSHESKDAAVHYPF